MQKMIIFVVGLFLVGCSVQKKPEQVLMSWESEYFTYDQSIKMAVHGIKCFFDDELVNEIINKASNKLKDDSGLSNDYEIVLLAAMIDENGYGFVKNNVTEEDEKYLGLISEKCFENDVLKLNPLIKIKYMVREYSEMPIDGFYNYKWCSGTTLKEEVAACEK